MLAVDLMHEFELGTWKAVFKHLIRLLHAASPGGQLVAELDKRHGDVLIFAAAPLISISDSGKSLPLAVIQFAGSLRMHQQ
jgi:hypothetical protein